MRRVLVPYKNMNADGVKYLPLNPIENIMGLPLSVMWHQENTRAYVKTMLDILAENSEELTRGL